MRRYRSHALRPRLSPSEAEALGETLRRSLRDIFHFPCQINGDVQKLAATLTVFLWAERLRDALFDKMMELDTDLAKQALADLDPAIEDSIQAKFDAEIAPCLVQVAVAGFPQFDRGEA